METTNLWRRRNEEKMLDKINSEFVVYIEIIAKETIKEREELQSDLNRSKYLLERWSVMKKI